MKDNFSEQSQNYANFRPKYPNAVFNEIMKHVSGRSKAWDCATGNGQVAEELSKLFNHVEATDISENQIKQAPKLKNINYSIQPAENVDFRDDIFDLISVAQAIHWFDFDLFYAEVKRTLKPDGILVVLGYSLFSSNKATNKIIKHFYDEVIGPYWDKEREYLDDAYASIPFPFKEIETPNINFKEEWSFDRLVGYLKTWSAVKHFIAANGYDPVDGIIPDLKASFGKKNNIEFPILFKIGKLS